MHWSILCSAPHQIKSYARTDNPLCTSWSKKPSLFNWGAPCFDSKTRSLLPTSYLKAHFLSKFLGWSDTLEWLALISKRQSIGLPQIHSAEEFYTLPNLSQGLELFLTIYLSGILWVFPNWTLSKITWDQRWVSLTFKILHYYLLKMMQRRPSNLIK